jgi:hypothetical protein
LAYDVLAYPPQALSTAIQATHGHGHILSWDTWMRHPQARYAALQAPRYRSLGPVLLLELALVLVLPAVVLWRVAWLFVTRLGRVTPGQPHGSARWMSEREVAALSYRPGHLLLGDAYGKSVGLDPVRQTMNTLLIGPPGAGKSTGVIIPNLLREPGTRSVVVTDLKGELQQICAGYLERAHEVWVVNFLDPGSSLAYNRWPTAPMSSLRHCFATPGSPTRGARRRTRFGTMRRGSCCWPGSRTSRPHCPTPRSATSTRCYATRRLMP